MTRLAEQQADSLKPGIPLGESSVDLSPLGGLVSDRVCRKTPDDHVVFAHDLFGDWARLRILISQGDDLKEFLASRLNS